jgi:hypothetical protein
MIWYGRNETDPVTGLPTTAEYYIKSNAISSVLGSTDKKTATVYTKASVYKIVNGITYSLDGNVTLRMDCADGKVTGTAGGDLVGFTILSSKDGSLYYSNNWQYSAKLGGWGTVMQNVWDNPVSITYTTTTATINYTGTASFSYNGIPATGTINLSTATVASLTAYLNTISTLSGKFTVSGGPGNFVITFNTGLDPTLLTGAYADGDGDLGIVIA